MTKIIFYLQPEETLTFVEDDFLCIRWSYVWNNHYVPSTAMVDIVNEYYFEN